MHDNPAAYKHETINEGPLLVEKISVFKGANYFSAAPVVVFRINLRDYDEVFTNDIPGFTGN